ncbi:phosphoadenosine phosphosulfate reductase family protein [Deferribacter thermophilus]|uniref:phosphoadenosine phosphosulfate reductase domain-containing protein n=1 Tax=Deferribacter thermophilus TaxID=53573 RepID=UPI003C21F8B4
MHKISDIIARLEQIDEKDILNIIADEFPDISTFSTSLGAEDQVITHILSQIDKSRKIEIFTLDTGRLFEETYKLINETQEKLSVSINIYFPDYKLLEEMVNKYGVNLFYDSSLEKNVAMLEK